VYPTSAWQREVRGGPLTMAWIRLDDGFADHPKVLAAGVEAAWLYVCGLCYASRQLTDGFIPAPKIRQLVTTREADALAERLVVVGLWERVEGGYAVHDYLDYQTSAATVKAERNGNAERQAQWRARQAEKKRGGSPPGSGNGPPPTPGHNAKDNDAVTPLRNDPRNVTHNALRNEPRNGPVTLRNGPVTDVLRDSPTHTPINVTRPAATLSVPAPALPREAAAAAVVDRELTYPTTLGAKNWSVALSLFAGLSKELHPGAVAAILADVERDVGPLPRDQLHVGLEAARASLRRAFDGEQAGKTAIVAVHPFAVRVIADRLREARYAPAH
jgi:hypothetical protein